MSEQRIINSVAIREPRMGNLERGFSSRGLPLPAIPRLEWPSQRFPFSLSLRAFLRQALYSQQHRNAKIPRSPDQKKRGGGKLKTKLFPSILVTLRRRGEGGAPTEVPVRLEHAGEGVQLYFDVHVAVGAPAPRVGAPPLCIQRVHGA